MTTWLRTFAPIDRKKALLLVLAIAASIGLGFVVFDQKTAVTIVHKGGYYWMLLCVILFGVSLCRAFEFAAVKKAFTNAGKGVLALVVGVTAWIHLQEPHGFKVVNDEIMLVSSSQRMHDRREAGTVARGYDLGRGYTIMQGIMDKRPVLFPFLVSIIHDVTGYRPENAFWFNAFLTPVFLYLLYFVGRELGGHIAGFSAVLLWATLPLFVQITNGAGFELLNLVMILTVFLLAVRYIQERSAARLSALCISAVLLAQVRYESVLYVISVGLVILYGWALDKKIVLSWGVLCAPLLLVITPLQANVVKISPNILQLSDRPSSSGVYSVSYFYDNVGSALNYFFSADGMHANSPLLALAGGVGVAFLFLVIYRDSKRGQQRTPTSVVIKVMLVALIAQSLLMICYFWGDYYDWITVRLSLPTQLLFVLAIVYIYPELVSWRHRWTLLTWLSIISITCWTIPTISRRGYAAYNQSAEYNNWFSSFAKSMDDKNVLVIDNGSRAWSLYGIGCIGTDTLAERSDGFSYHYNRGSFTSFILVQQYELGSLQTGALVPTEGSDFGGSFKLTKLREMRCSPVNMVRLSRIDGINEEAFAAWSKKRVAEKGKPAAPARLTPEEHQAYLQEWRANLP